jgi:hypothetical protein
VKILFVNLVAAICILLCSVSYGQNLQALAFEELPDGILAAEDLSAVETFGPFLVIGSDEGVGKDNNKNFIQLLRKNTEGQYKVYSNILLFEGNKEEGKEMDIEGLAAEGNTIYVLGSHSSKRNKVKEDKSYKKNRKTFSDSKIDDERNRDWLYRLTMDSQGDEITKERITLRKIIKKDTVLKTFADIPSKENGVDIEGLAVKDGCLYLGFRGPVFRENYVPVMKLKFDDPKDTYELLYLKLDGRGIRAMTSVSDGFLIVAGPVGDGPASYQLYHWDGQDIIPGKDRKSANLGQIRLLGEIHPPQDGKAEGVVVLQQNDTKYQLLIVYDGAKNKAMQSFHLAKP